MPFDITELSGPHDSCDAIDIQLYLFGKYVFRAVKTFIPYFSLRLPRLII